MRWQLLDCPDCGKLSLGQTGCFWQRTHCGLFITGSALNYSDHHRQGQKQSETS